MLHFLSSICASIPFKNHNKNAADHLKFQLPVVNMGERERENKSVKKYMFIIRKTIIYNINKIEKQKYALGKNNSNGRSIFTKRKIEQEWNE